MTRRFAFSRSIFVLTAVLIGTSGFARQLAAQPQNDPPVQVLTGCLRSSAADTAVAGPSGRIFTLEAVEQPRPGTDAGAGGAPARPTKTTYSLSAPESLALAKHADHEVQLTGRLQTTAAAPSRPGAPARDTAKPAAGGGHRTFEVSALKMVSTNCP